MTAFLTRHRFSILCIMSLVIGVMIASAIIGEKTFEVRLSRRRECVISSFGECTIEFMGEGGGTLPCEWDCSVLSVNSTEIIPCYQVPNESCPQSDGAPQIWSAVFSLLTLVSLIILTMTAIFWIAYTCAKPVGFKTKEALPLII